MKKTSKIFALLLMLSLILLPTQTVAAKGVPNGPVIFGGSYTLQSGESLAGDVVVFGGVVTIESAAEVNGDVLLFGGSLTINGQVSGDVVQIGGVAFLGDESLIEGNLSLVGATLNREDGAQVNGDIIYNAAGSHADETPFSPNLPFVNQAPFAFNAKPLWVVLGVFGRSVAMALLAMLVVLFLEEPTRRIGEASASQPAIAGGLGFLTFALAPFVLLVLAITILMIPVAFLAIVVLMVALLYGWIALGVEVGLRFTKMIKQDWALPLTAAFGVWLLTIISASIGLIPCVGWLAPFVLANLALGAVIMTRFGSRSALAPVAPASAALAPLPPVDGEEAKE